jgi:ketosteroid isomerase-like protein
MSQENVEIVRRMYAAFHAGDTGGALACFDPDVVVDFSRRADGRVGRGREYLSQVVASWMGAWEEWRQEIDEVRDLGSRVYVFATQRGRGKGSGVEIDQRFAILYEVEGDSIINVTYYPQPAEALEAAGLSE